MKLLSNSLKKWFSTLLTSRTKKAVRQQLTFLLHFVKKMFKIKVKTKKVSLYLHIFFKTRKWLSIASVSFN